MEEKKEMSTEEIKMDNDPKGEGKEKASSPLREVLSWVVTLLAAFALAMVLKNYVIINATVPTGSMEHTIEPGDDLFGLRLAYQFSEPKRGDIVIFRFPDDETQKYVKRVIGLPGEKVTIEDAKIYINDSETPLKEDYLKETWTEATGPFEFEVPKDSYLVLGDNRNDSYDARYWDHTYVSKDKIIGKAYFICSPFQRLGISSISMKKLMVEISKKNMFISESSVLFSSRDNQLAEIIKMVNSIPEINLGMFDTNAPLNAENVALLTKMWVHGYSIRAIADKCINNADYDAQEKMNICGKYIYSKLINNLPWGIAAIFKAQGIVNPQESNDDTYPLIPAFIYFGVNSVVAVALCMLGVPRYAARILAKEWYNKKGDVSIKQCEKVKEWIYSLNLEDWKQIFNAYEGKNTETNYNIWLKNR